MPLAAVLAREELDCAPQKALGHYTHEKSPVAAAAANALLDVVLEEGLALRSRELGERVLARLREAALLLPSIGEVRGRGLLIGMELVRPGSREPDDQLAEQLLYRCLGTGLSFKVSAGNVVTLTPPLNIEESLLFGAVEMLLGHLRALTT
jgi:4-aminobutyrate aminotransferase